MPMTRCPLDKGTLGQILLSPFEDGHYSDTLYKFLASHKCLEDTGHGIPQRALRYPYNKVQGPPIIVGWTKVVSTTPAWGIEPTTSSLGVISPNHQAKAHGALSQSNRIDDTNNVFSVVVGGWRMQLGLQTTVPPLGAWGHDR